MYCGRQDKILDMAKELRGDLCIVATALKKVQEQEGEVDPDLVTSFLSLGLDPALATPHGSRCSTPATASPPEHTVLSGSGSETPSPGPADTLGNLPTVPTR